MPKLFQVFLLIFLSMPMLSRAKDVGSRSPQTDTADIKKSFLPLISYMERGLRYPSEAKEFGVQLTVIIEFDLTDNGAIANARIINADEVEKNGHGVAKEALRVLNSFKDKKKLLKPGNYLLPVTFVFNQDQLIPQIDPELKKRPNCLYHIIVLGG